MRAAAIARLTLVLLVIATLLAIFYAQELKQRGSVLLLPKPGVIRFQPAGPPRRPPLDRLAHFKVRATIGDTLEVEIVSERSGRVVFVITVSVREWHHVALSWDGRDRAGALQPPGTYLIDVHFVHADRTVPARATLELLGPRA